MTKQTQLVLSLFPGIGLLDMAFEQEGFCVVQSRDWIMGGDVRQCHFPLGRFDGVIGGPPCQAFSRLAHMVRHNGYEPKFGNLIPEFERVVSETQPQWFLMEEVPDAPRPRVNGYENHEFTLNNRQCLDAATGEPAVQNRVRAITFGWRGTRHVLLIDTAAMHNQRWEYAACGGSSGASLGAAGWDGGPQNKSTRKHSRLPFNAKGAAAAQELCRKQGLPDDFIGRFPFRKDALCKAIGNGVPLPMGRALAKAVAEAIACDERSV